MTKESTLHDSSMKGLTDEEVLKSRSEHGRNILTPPHRESAWKLYLDKYRDPIIIILLVAAAISFVLAFFEHDFIETIGIFIAIFLSTTIGFVFEMDASRKFRVLTAMNEEQPVKVIRNGKVTTVPRHDIVVGDTVLIETGDEVPADGILFSAHELQIDESSLTGEPIAEKNTAWSGKTSHGAYPIDKVLRSSMVMIGRGAFTVTAVGDSTEIGHVAQASTETTSVKTPLRLQLDKLAGIISKIGSAVAVLSFLTFLIHDIISNGTLWHSGNYMLMAKEVLGYFMMSVTLIVMAVPEGLPMAVTLALALNMRRMLKSNNLVRKLHASETMGAVNVICTDKTGTLTRNKMTVGNITIFYGDDVMLAHAIAANTTASLDGDKPIGNPTEGALLVWLKEKGFDYRELRRSAGITAQEAFSTERKYMLTKAVWTDGKEHTLIKGAPEIIMQRCNMSDDERQKAEKLLNEFQNKAMRTLAFAIDDHFEAIAAISDPIRDEVPAAVDTCHKAGIEVKIVTGDTLATALEIGRQIHLFDDIATDSERPLKEQIPSELYITGEEWAALSDEEALKRAVSLRVMSRARPADKQRLVKILQKHGDVVAVTGDGTNDAPALHHAHVGLSLGSGTSVAKEASDMTLLDDSFNSIANAVMWGRSLYKNIQRFLFFQLVVNLTALLLVVAGSLIGTEMPLTVTQILWINLIMDTFAAMALASLPPSREVMKDKPRKVGEPILTPMLNRNILGWGLFFFAIMLVFLVWCERHGTGSVVDVHELTLFFTTFVMLQFWNLFNAKCIGSRHSCFRHIMHDKALLLVLLFIFAGQWLIVSFGGKMFRTVPLSAHEWIIITAATSAVMWVGEIKRAIERSLSRKNAPEETK